MTQQELDKLVEVDKLVWEQIQKADNWMTPELSDGYNESEVHSACILSIYAYIMSDEYKQLELDAEKWRAFVKIDELRKEKKKRQLRRKERNKMY